jgi:hypothetical protein
MYVYAGHSLNLPMNKGFRFVIIDVVYTSNPQDFNLSLNLHKFLVSCN